MYRSYILAASLLTFPLLIQAQTLDFFQSAGKIYSVFAVILLVFIFILVYLFRLDKKITKLEENINNES